MVAILGPLDVELGQARIAQVDPRRADIAPTQVTLDRNMSAPAILG